MSRIQRYHFQAKHGGRTAASDLKQVLLSVVLEHTRLDLDEVVRHQQRQQRVVVRIHRDIHRDHAHVDQHGVNSCKDCQ